MKTKKYNTQVFHLKSIKKSYKLLLIFHCLKNKFWTCYSENQGLLRQLNLSSIVSLLQQYFDDRD